MQVQSGCRVSALKNYAASGSQFLHLLNGYKSIPSPTSWATTHWTKSWQICTYIMRRLDAEGAASCMGLLCSLVTKTSRKKGMFFSHPLSCFKSKLNWGWKLVLNLPFVYRIIFNLLQFFFFTNMHFPLLIHFLTLIQWAPTRCRDLFTVIQAQSLPENQKPFSECPSSSMQRWLRADKPNFNSGLFYFRKYQWQGRWGTAKEPEKQTKMELSACN